MTNDQLLKTAIALHARILLLLLDAVDRAESDVERILRIDMIRTAITEFKNDFTKGIE